MEKQQHTVKSLEVGFQNLSKSTKISEPSIDFEHDIVATEVEQAYRMYVPPVLGAWPDSTA